MDAASQRFSLRDVLLVIFSKLHVFKWTFLIIVVATNSVAFLSPYIYQVTAQVLIKPSFDSNLLFEATVSRLQADPVTPQIINSEINIMLSTELLRRVVKDMELYATAPPGQSPLARLKEKIKNLKLELKEKLGISSQSDPIEQAIEDLRSDLKIKPVTMSNIIEVTYSGKDPEEITSVVNTLIDRYIDQHIHVHQAPEGEQFFAVQAETYRQKLTEAETSLQDFQREWSISDITAQRASNLEVLKLLRENLVMVNGKIAEQETRLKLSREDMEAMTRENIQNPVLSDLTRSLLPLLVERSRIATLYPKSSVEYQDIDNQVSELTAKIQAELHNALSGAEIDLSALMRQKSEFEEAIKNIEETSVMLTEKEVELKRLNRHIAEYEKNYTLYRQKAEEARIEKQKDLSRVSNVSVSSWATKPTVPVFPKRFLMAVLSLVVGFLLGVAGTFVAYYLDHTIKNPTDLPNSANIPILSTINLVEEQK